MSCGERPFQHQETGAGTVSVLSCEYGDGVKARCRCQLDWAAGVQVRNVTLGVSGRVLGELESGG